METATKKRIKIYYCYQWKVDGDYRIFRIDEIEFYEY